jgi:catalase (peroxidase I)
MTPECCGLEAIENEANGNKFWYCKQCKKEVPDSVDDSYSILSEFHDISIDMGEKELEDLLDKNQDAFDYDWSSYDPFFGITDYDENDP